MKSRSYIGFGLAAIIALIAVTAFMADQIQTTNAAGGGPEMKLTVVGCEGDTCTVAEGGAFTLTTEIVEGPAGGYILAQTYIVYGPDLVYKPTASRADEFVWPECEGVTALGVFWTSDGATTTDIDAAVAVNHGCLTGLIGPQPSTYSGTMIELSFNCSSAASSTEIVLLPVGDDIAGTSGAALKDEGNVEHTPKITNVTVNCGSDGGDTPVPTTPPVATTPPAATDTPEPTDTPVPPDELCGDLNKDGGVDSRDALWVLWFTAGLVSELDNDGDVNGDGSVTAVDASLILQAEAGLVETPCV